MYHNYLIATPTHNITLSIDVGDIEIASVAEEGVVIYPNTYTLYIDKQRVGAVKMLIIASKHIVAHFRTEELT
jgi:hypothetical protein